MKSGQAEAQSVAYPAHRPVSARKERLGLVSFAFAEHATPNTVVSTTAQDTQLGDSLISGSLFGDPDGHFGARVIEPRVEFTFHVACHMGRFRHKVVLLADIPGKVIQLNRSVIIVFD